MIPTAEKDEDNNAEVTEEEAEKIVSSVCFSKSAEDTGKK